MSGITVLLGAAALLIGAGLLLAPPISRLLARRAARYATAPTPAAWHRIVERDLQGLRGLDTVRRERLLRLARDLIETRHWETAGGLELTDAMRVTIATQAAQLVVELPGEPYPHLRSVLIYPSTFIPAEGYDPYSSARARPRGPHFPELGESWPDGVVVIAWDAARAGARRPADGRNVVFHEFAHLLDFQYQLTPGEADLSGTVAAPGFDPSWASSRASTGDDPDFPGSAGWRRALTEAYERHCVSIGRGDPTVLDPYGGTNEAEFFAVATEAFFERPAQLAAEHPEIYRYLVAFYRQDPG